MSDELPELTTREIQVLSLMAEGHTEESIANQLGISKKTVSVHKTNMYAKCHQSNAISLIRVFYNIVPKAEPAQLRKAEQ